MSKETRAPPKLKDVTDHHLRGTSFGIGVDPADACFKQGQEHYQLTWMDASGGWGRHAAARAMRGDQCALVQCAPPARGLARGGTPGGRRRKEDASLFPFKEANARVYSGHAECTREAFNKRLWYVEGGYL